MVWKMQSKQIMERKEKKEWKQKKETKQKRERKQKVEKKIASKPSILQKRRLLDYVKTKRSAKNPINKELMEELNSLGEFKDEQQWKRCWRDWKGNATNKAKLLENGKKARPLTAMEKELLDLYGIAYPADPNIPSTSVNDAATLKAIDQVLEEAKDGKLDEETKASSFLPKNSSKRNQNDLDEASIAKKPKGYTNDLSIENVQNTASPSISPIRSDSEVLEQVVSDEAEKLPSETSEKPGEEELNSRIDQNNSQEIQNCQVNVDNSAIENVQNCVPLNSPSHVEKLENLPKPKDLEEEESNRFTLTKSDLEIFVENQNLLKVNPEESKEYQNKIQEILNYLLNTKNPSTSIQNFQNFVSPPNSPSDLDELPGLGAEDLFFYEDLEQIDTAATASKMLGMDLHDESDPTLSALLDWVVECEQAQDKNHFMSTSK